LGRIALAPEWIGMRYAMSHDSKMERPGRVCLLTDEQIDERLAIYNPSGALKRDLAEVWGRTENIIMPVAHDFWASFFKRFDLGDVKSQKSLDITLAPGYAGSRSMPAIFCI
jgi:hypothetical protein